MITVHLDKLIFHGYHGLYEEETRTGNTFEVSLHVSYEEKKQLDNLKNLINYETLFHIVKKRMGIPTPLLEELAEGIIRKIRHEYSGIKDISVTILKVNAPIEGIEGRVGISLSRKYDD